MPQPTLGMLQVDDLFYVTFKGRLFGQRMLNTFYYACFQLPIVNITRWTAYSQLRDTLIAADGLKEKLLACIAPQYTLEAIRLQIVSPIRLAFREFQDGASGNHADQCDTPNIAASVERRCELADRHGVGRIQVPGCPTSAQNAGVWKDPYITKLNALATVLAQDVDYSAGAAWHPSLAFSDGLVPPTWTSSPIIGAEAKSTIRVMRRRTVGEGE
jgi:hypothetical protein